MTITGRHKIAFAVAAVIAALAIVVAFLLPHPLQEPQIQPPPTVPADPPGPVSEAWANVEARAQLEVILDQEGPVWRLGGRTLLRGPMIEDLQWEWNRFENDGWRLATGVGQLDNAQVTLNIWTQPSWPGAILDVYLVVQNEALLEPLRARTAIEGGTQEILTTGLERLSGTAQAERSIRGGRFDTPGKTLQIHSASNLRGQLQSMVSEVAIDWELWPGSDAMTPCANEPDANRVVHQRLIVEFGDHQTALAAPTDTDLRALGTPIFVDPPRRSDDAWADGRARDAGEYARRLRALAFGHSDTEDPRYGNGGLLAANLGAVFAVPTEWWEDEAIRELHLSLTDTRIELLPLNPHLQQEFLEHRAALITERSCAVLFPPEPDAPPLLAVLLQESFERASQFDLAYPLPPVIETGQAPAVRDTILERLFMPGRRDSLLVDGEHRVLAFPLVATRNPLLDSSAHTLLSPDRGGHWTLHDTLTRSLSGWEMQQHNRRYRMVSLQTTLRQRLAQQESLVMREPDGELLLHYVQDALYEPELLFLGPDDADEIVPLDIVFN